MREIVIIGTVILLIQTLLSIYQANYYNNYVNKIKKRMTHDDRLSYNRKKNYISSKIVIIISEKKMIKEIHYLNGKFIFSKFRRDTENENKLLSLELINTLQINMNNKDDVLIELLKKLLEDYMFETEIIEIGDLVPSFKEESILILFGPKVTNELKPITVVHDLKNKSNNSIQKGGKLYIGNNEYEIVKVGKAANKNFDDLGHISIYFRDGDEDILPGSIQVRPNKYPVFDVGTIIRFEK